MALTVQDSSDIQAGKFFSALVLGAAKTGKTTCCISTAEKPVFVINSDQRDSLMAAKRVSDDFKFVGPVHTIRQMDEAIRLAAGLVSEGKCKTVVWDTMTGFATHLEEECFQPGPSGKVPDGRLAWYSYKKTMMNFIGRLLRLDANVVVISHYYELGAESDGQVSKTGPGIVPGMAGGDLRSRIPGEFSNVLFMEKRKDRRVFVTGIDGVYGPGCRNLDGNQEIDADLGKFAELLRTGGKSAAKVAK